MENRGRLCVFALLFYVLFMNDNDQPKSPEEPEEAAVEPQLKRGQRGEAERKLRAAAKLRENLQRRKQQSRSRRAGEQDVTIGLPAAKTDESS